MPSIIDIHPHVICPDTTRYPLAPLGGTQSTWSRDRPTSFETMIKEMDAAGVAKSAIVQASTAYGHDNSYVAEAIAAYPKRFTGVFSVDVLAPDAVDKMKHWIGRGFSGMRLFTTGSTMPGQATWFADPSTFPAWEYAGEAGIPVCMQMTPQGFPQLRGLMDRFPKVRIILDHLARPQLTDGPPFTADQPFFDLAKYGQVFLKVTPVNVEPKDRGKGPAAPPCRPPPCPRPPVSCQPQKLGPGFSRGGAGKWGAEGRGRGAPGPPSPRSFGS